MCREVRACAGRCVQVQGGAAAVPHLPVREVVLVLALVLIASGRPYELSFDALPVAQRANEYVAIDMVEPSLAVHQACRPVASVPRAVREYARASPVALVVTKLALVALCLRRDFHGAMEPAE